MAFITLRRTRNTRGYYLVESYRDKEGRARKRTLCYLGRQQDGTDTLAKALDHWQSIKEAAHRELKTARGVRRRMLRNRIKEIEERLAAIRPHAEHVARKEEERRRRLEEAPHWQAIERLRLTPSHEHAKAAKRAYRQLALRLHPDQGGTHAEFIRLTDTYNIADGAYRRWAA
jgi:hypothetical protein